jgi:hypothetical protein
LDDDIEAGGDDAQVSQRCRRDERARARGRG